MTEQESNAQYRLVASEAAQWEETASSLFYSAHVLKDHLLELVERDPAGFRRVETLGLVHSTMLLLGLAAENMLKAVYIAMNPALVSQNGLNTSSWKAIGGKGKGAHGSLGLARHLLQLTPDEEDLLNRLQEHVVWAGKYPVPLRPIEYHTSHYPDKKRRFSPDDDFASIDGLFKRLKALIHKHPHDFAS